MSRTKSCDKPRASLRFEKGKISQFSRIYRSIQSFFLNRSEDLDKPFSIAGSLPSQKRVRGEGH